ncbi:MAG: outer membrane beta-barrel protein, partial [Gammaproteobacteria bacterium]|nr:outer membrane beta-barrel protein [Gammaproteobacteria bacterium]
MRHFILLGVILALVASPALGNPLDGKFEFGVQGGMNMPTGNIGDGTNNGYVFGVNAGFRPIDMLVVGAEFAMFGNGATDEVLQLLGPTADVNTTTFQYALMAKAMLPVLEMHHVYAKGLLGAYTSSVDFSNLPGIANGSTSDTNFGFGIGGGFRFNTAVKYSFFAEGMY